MASLDQRNETPFAQLTCRECAPGSFASAIVWPSRMALHRHALTHWHGNGPRPTLMFYGGLAGTGVTVLTYFWHLYNLPPQMGQLEDVPRQNNAHYSQILINGILVDDIPGVPMYLNPKEDWLVEALIRAIPGGVENRNFLVRMGVTDPEKLAKSSKLSQARKRVRDRLGMIAWKSRSSENREPKIAVVGNLTDMHLKLNTTWDWTYMGYVYQPRPHDLDPQTPWSPFVYPAITKYFPHQMSESLADAADMAEKLSIAAVDLAFEKHGEAIDPANVDWRSTLSDEQKEALGMYKRY